MHVCACAGHDAHHGQQRGGGGRAGRFCPRADDPVLDHLLRDFRSPHLRKLFLAHKPEEYMEVLDLKLLVRGACVRVCACVCGCVWCVLGW
jgi:hypothetical protein